MVKYTYNAWGRCRSTGNSTIASINPYRYRGYYYDTESGLYFAETTMDMAFSMLYVGYFNGIANKTLGTALNSLVDGAVDVIQTYLYLTPNAQNRIRNA